MPPSDATPQAAVIDQPSQFGPARPGPWTTLLTVVQQPTPLLVAMVAAMLLLDLPVSQWVHRTTFAPVLKALFGVVRLPGNFKFTALLALVLVWPLRRSWKTAAVLLIAGATSSCLTAVLKWCLGRTRPYRGAAAFAWHPFPCSPLDNLHTRDLSFPSGDATLAFATAAVLASVFPRYRTAAFVWAVLVALVRVLQGAHYPSDVIGGAIVGIGTARLIWPTGGPSRGLRVPGRRTADS